MLESKKIPYQEYQQYPETEMLQRSAEFYQEMSRRRSVRHFSNRPVPPAVIENCLKAAITAPSGANRQPWHFVVVRHPAVKKQLREAAEQVEFEFYQQKASQEWLDALKPLEMRPQKEFLEIAPCLIVLFAERFGLTPDGKKIKNYYVSESVGLAAGFLLAALHHAGLACLTYTPAPMHFLTNLLQRPANERPFIIFVVGYPAENATVPVIEKKDLEAVVSYFDALP